MANNLVIGLILLLSLQAILGQPTSLHTEFPGLDNIKPSTSSGTQTQAVQDLIRRQIQDRAEDFTVLVDTSLRRSEKDMFKVSAVDGQVTLRGSSGVAAAMGFYYYLKQYCGCHTSWAGSQWALPQPLPDTQGTVTVTTNDRFRYYQNVCTVSYSFVWWQWERWEREIDWMAMQGINLPLAFNGQEAIWNKVFLEMGFSQPEVDEFFAGPAFLAWGRMGNIRGWGGPLPASWHSQQVALQHLILQRMRDLGMTPILPAFSGYVPHAITRLFPNVSVTPSSWGSFPQNYSHVYLVNVTDPLFQKIGSKFLTEYTKEFGTDHMYNTDTFNEMRPASGDPSYLAQAGQAVYRAMTAADKQAVWVMQGWLFMDTGFWTPDRAKALLTAIPRQLGVLPRCFLNLKAIAKTLYTNLKPSKGEMLILDLASESYSIYPRYQSYFGQPFIWCMLHNFGGSVQMYGMIEAVNQGPPRGRAYPHSTMVGIGLTPEGINQNNVIYEFMMEHSWRTKARNLTQWFSSYPVQRYGKSNAAVEAGWQFLKSSVYNCTDGNMNHGHGYVVIVKRPSLTSKPDVWYDTNAVFQAWDQFVSAADDLQDSPLFRYDVVDVSRQALQIIGAALQQNIAQAYSKKSLADLKGNSSLLLQLFTDMDGLLASDPHFLLGRWLQDAKALATNDQEMAHYEFNARNQVTLWGPSGNILDYSNKQWSGLVKDYYRSRWELFTQELEYALLEGEDFDPNRFNQDCFNLVEKPFNYKRDIYPVDSRGDSVVLAKEIHAKYRPLSQKYRDVLRKMRASPHAPLISAGSRSTSYPSYLAADYHK